MKTPRTNAAGKEAHERNTKITAEVTQIARIIGRVLVVTLGGLVSPCPDGAEPEYQLSSQQPKATAWIMYEEPVVMQLFVIAVLVHATYV